MEEAALNLGCRGWRLFRRVVFPLALPGYLAGAALSYRPHVVRLQDAAAARDPALLWLEGAVEAAEFLGETTRYGVRVGKLALTADQVHLGGMRNFSEGNRVCLGVAPSQLRCLRD